MCDSLDSGSQFTLLGLTQTSFVALGKLLSPLLGLHKSPYTEVQLFWVYLLPLLHATFLKPVIVWICP